MKITKVLQIKYGPERRYATAEVQLDDGSTGWTYVGGECEAYFDHAHNRTKVHIKRNKATIDSK